LHLVGNLFELYDDARTYKPFFPMVQQPLMDQGHLIIQPLRSHLDTLHSVGLL